MVFIRICVSKCCMELGLLENPNGSILQWKGTWGVIKAVLLPHDSSMEIW